jgi:hypothetical protein
MNFTIFSSRRCLNGRLRPLERRIQRRASGIALTAIGMLSAALTASIMPAHAKPIAFAEAWTFMHERDSDMIETDLYYAPTYWFSLGPTVLIARADDKQTRREAAIFHTNFLVKRWNLPNAQGNIFATLGAGRVKTTRTVANPNPLASGLPISGAPTREVENKESTQHLTLQGDFETRQFFSAVKMDAHRASSFLDRTDTAQIGFSPFAHDYEDLAVWFIAQVKKKRGINNETEGGAFIRLFKRNIWVELGVTEGRKSQMMLMINY